MNSEFSFSLTSCLTKAEEPSLPYYLPIAGGRIIGFIPFLRVLVLCEMQSVSSRIWTRVAVSISYDDNHYTTFVLTSPAVRSIPWSSHWNVSGCIAVVSIQHFNPKSLSRMLNYNCLVADLVKPLGLLYSVLRKVLLVHWFNNQ